VRPESARIGIDAGRLDQLLRQTAAADLALGNEFLAYDPLVVGVGDEGFEVEDLTDDETTTVSGDETGETLLESGNGVTTFDSEVTLSPSNDD
jgi:hypothetical protein